MVHADFTGASPNAHLLIGEMPAPRQLRPRWREGTGVSVVAHAVAFGILLYAATHVPQVVQTANAVAEKLPDVFLYRPGAGRTPGSGNGSTPEPARQAQSPPRKPREIMPSPAPTDTPPIPDVTIPVIASQAVETLPGAATSITISPGPGSGPGGGTGRGPGGPGEGPGRGGAGGDIYTIGYGVTAPVLTREVKPSYTGEAMRAKVQGVVDLDAVVLPDGSIDPRSIQITRSLDKTFGIDEQAIIAVKQWHFRPGTYKGQPVAVRVAIELAFTLR